MTEEELKGLRDAYAEAKHRRIMLGMIGSLTQDRTKVQWALDQDREDAEMNNEDWWEHSRGRR